MKTLVVFLKRVANFEHVPFKEQKSIKLSINCPCKTKMELDKNTRLRFEDISTLTDENKNFVLNMIDMTLRDFKTKKAYAK